jgi:hypothetical protein
MKKIMFLSMLGITFSFCTYASNDVKKENLEVQSKNKSEVLTTKKTNLYTDLCLSFEVWTTDCPDGSVGLVAIDAFIVDCESGEALAGATVYSASLNEACGN